MPRHPRVHAEGLLYHVIARGNDRQKIFLRESDYQAFIEALRTVRERYPFSLYAYVLMSNHVLCGAQHNVCYVKLRVM